MARLAAVMAVGVLLAGCAAVPPKGPSTEDREAAFQAHAARVRALSEWTLYARAAINTAQDSGSVSLFWSQRGESYSLTLRAPLGSGTVQLRGDGQTVRLRSSDGRSDSAGDAALLIRRHTGYVLPVEQLRHWVLGMPAPGVPQDERSVNDTGYVTELEQSGWRLEFDDYRRVDGVALPGTIRARGQGIELKLAVQQWSGLGRTAAKQ